MLVQSVKDAFQRLLCDLEITFNRVSTIHKYFGFDYRYQILFLTKCRVTCKRFSVRVDACARGNVLPNRNHGAPFCEPCSQFPVFGQSLAQSVKTLGNFFPWKIRHSLGAVVHFNPGYDSLILQCFHESAPIASLLPNRLVKENYAADKFTCAGCSK